MSALTLSFLCLFCWALHLQPTGALNLDPLSPTVVNSGIPEGSSTGFGWTLSQHAFSDGRKSVLVSTPTANGTESREGGVYSCPFDVGGACQLQELFLNREVVMDNPFQLGLQTNRSLAFQGQLMGYSLKSSGGVVIACAPLYVQSIGRIIFEGVDYSSGNPSGRCIILNSDLSTTTQAYPERLGTVMLAGLDIEILKNGENRSFVLSNSFSSAGQGGRGGQLILSNSVSRDGISGTERTITPTVSVDSLYGFHLESGQFTQLGTPEIVTSSPRSRDHFGEVAVVVSNNLIAGAVLTFIGEEADGYFGYDFAVLDLGHGGYNSLAVGCPLCDRERGRVYIYAHTGDPSAPLVESVVSPPPSAARGRFGLAVENIGDVDLDGFSDLAVSAPYEDAGRVYVYRGSRSGVVSDDFQILNAVPDTTAFGYSLSGGMDIDGNGYPDLTVGDLSGERVTTLRGSPLANVTLVIPDRQDMLDIAGSSDRLCPLNGILAHCFNVTPCFFYETKQDDIPQIALQYNLTVDNGRSRVSTYSAGPEGVVLGTPAISGVITVTGTGRANMVCANTVTFALNPNFVEIDSILVRLSVEDAPVLLSLERDPDLAQFGDPLHPVLMRYIEGDVRAPLTLEYQIASNLNCSFGSDPRLCEGEFALVVSEIIQTQSSGNQLLLASSNEFGFQLDVTNTAEDTAVNPVLIIELPRQTRLSRTVPAANCNFRTGVSADNGTTLECDLKNPTASGEVLSLTTFFLFNDTSALLGTEQLEIQFSVRDGGTQRISDVVSKIIRLDAVSDYNLALMIAQVEYRATRSAVVFPDVTALTLEQLGPQVTLRAFLQNSRTASTGTPFPRSTLYINVPREIVDNEGARPLLVPFQVIITDRGSTVNCSQFEAVPEQLSSVQRPSDFLPPWLGPRPPASPECERNGTLRCGTIICTIFDLQPLPEPPTVLTLFARLYSPSIDERRERLAITSQVTSDTDLPRIGSASIQAALQEVTFSPGPREVQRDCIKYWVVVVSVVIGIFALVIIIIVLAMCGVFRRWYKDKREDELDGVEHTDQELTYQRRTIPPLPQLTNGTPSSPPPEEWRKELEKEQEAEEDHQREIREMGIGKPLARSSPPPGSPTTDPIDIGEGMETDL